jgi:O-antigen/teichoic acid export membrane protein
MTSSSLLSHPILRGPQKGMAESCAPTVVLAKPPISRGLSLRANFSWTFVGNSIYSACQWGALVALAKLTSPVLVGQYSLGVAIAMPVISLTGLQLRSVIASDVRESYKFGEYAGFRLFSTALAVLAILAIPLVLHSGPLMTLLTFVIGLSLAIENISDVYYARLQSIDRMDRIAKSQILRAPLSLLALGLGVYFTGRLSWGVAAMVLVRTAVLLGYDRRVHTQSSEPLASNSPESHAAFERLKELLQPRWELRRMVRILWLALPLGVVAMLVNLNVNIPRYFIQWKLGTRELGIYSALAFLMSAGNLLVNALAQAVFVHLARFYAEGRRRAFVLLLLKLLAIGTVLGVGGIVVAWLAGAELLAIIYRPEYAVESRLLVWFMVVAWIGYLGQFLGGAMTSARLFVHQIPLFALGVSVITLGSYWLVPRMGLQGAIVATMAGVLVQLLASVAVLGYGLINLPEMRKEAATLA